MKKTVICMAVVWGAFVSPSYALAPSAVTVDSRVLNNLGAAPNPANLIVRDQQFNKPFYAAPALRSKASATPRELPAPPLKKPQSRIVQAGAMPDNPIRFSKYGKKIAGDYRNQTPQSTFIFADSDARGKFAPMSGASNNAAGLAAPAFGFQWSDIDPRTRGLGMTVTNPNSTNGQVMAQIAFDKTDTDLNAKAKSQLKDAGQKLKSASASADLHGYASGDASDAKRTALTRILTVRDTLIAMGVPGNLLGVKPMGIATDNGPKDRVDIVVKK